MELFLEIYSFEILSPVDAVLWLKVRNPELILYIDYGVKG